MMDFETTISNDLSMYSNFTPSYNLVISNGIKEAVRVTPDGRVILAPDVTLDEASREFWRAIEQMAPGICQQVIDARRNRP